MKYKNTIPYIILQQGGSIKYNPTESQTEIPEIQGYKRQFSIQAPQGDSTEENKSPQIIYIQAPPQQPTTEEPVVTEEKTETKPDKTNWSDIKSVIIGNEGFMSTAKALFNEPNASVGYGFFSVLPDGRKITPGMTITRDEANKQLDIAINKLSNSIKNSLSKYNLKTSPEQLNVLIDLGYHAGAGTVDKLLKESNGDSTKIGSLLLRYATRAKYGDTSINGALEGRALRRSQAWNKYVLKGQNGLKLPKFQNSGKLPFWSRLARQLQSAPSNGETTIAAHSADLNRQVEQARKEAKSKGQNPDRAEEEVYRRGLRTNGAMVGGAALGALATTVPAVAETVKFATKTPVDKKALQKVMKDTAISMAGGTAVDALSNKMTGMSFGKYIAGAIPGARNLYDRSAIARFGIDMLNPGYLGLSGSKALIEGTQKGVTNLAHKVDNAATIANARLTGKLKFGNPTTYTGIHQSNTPLTEVKFPFNRWDVTTHGADPNGFWLTLAETPNTEGTMANRPFASRWTATAQKPLIQTGEIEGRIKGKNNLRNTIVRYGKRRGADAFEFRGIKDNALPTTNVVMVTDKTNPTLIEQIPAKLKLPETAKSMTDAEWDAAYKAAVKSGDIAEAQRLRNLHFLSKAPDTKIINESGMPKEVYHGSRDKKFTIFDSSKTRSDYDYGTSTNMFTDNKTVGLGYAENDEAGLRSVYLNLKNIAEKDFKGNSWNGSVEHTGKYQIMPIYDETYSSGQEAEKALQKMLDEYYPNNPVKQAEQRQYMRVFELGDSPHPEKSTNAFSDEIAKNPALDGGIAKRVKDYYDLPSKQDNPQLYEELTAPHTDYFVKDPRNIKSSAAITYDDTGKIIPLSKRDNFSNPDIRYGIIPLSILGGSTILNLNKKPNSK